MYFTEEGSEAAVIERLKDCRDPRFRQIMESAIRHLHAFVKEVEPSPQEWAEAIAFLTATGQKCDDRRQEWILASDTLGVSMLVETLNNRATAGATEATVLGPFHVDGAPTLPMGASIVTETDAGDTGEPCAVSGTVRATDGAPLAGAVLDVWQTDGAGIYDVQRDDPSGALDLRGRFVTGADGRYDFLTVKPVSYPIPTDGPVGAMLERMGRHPYRPAHIHFIVSAPGYRKLVTHIFVAGDPYLESDAVFGVKESLIVPFERDAAGLWAARFDIALRPEPSDGASLP